MTTYEDANGGALPFRVRALEKMIDRLNEWRGVVDTERGVQAERLAVLGHDLGELTQAVDSLRKVILGFALSIAGSAVVFAFSVLVATGKL